MSLLARVHNSGNLEFRSIKIWHNARPDCLLARDLIPTWRTRMYTDNLSLFFSFLSLRFCLCLGRPRLHVRRNDASRSTSTREWNSFAPVYTKVSCAHACADACMARVNQALVQKAPFQFASTLNFTNYNT